MPGGVFISYRREDSAGFARLIYDRLTKHLERRNVFFDVDDIPPGVDFVDVLTKSVGTCDALVAVIGRGWISSADRDNRRRLDDPHDFVRIEIQVALERGARVIPVLIDGAAMPKADDLPDGLRELARQQGIEISHARFDSDVERLIRALSPPAWRRRARNWLAAAGTAVIAVMAAAALLIGEFGPRHGNTPQVEPNPRAASPSIQRIYSELARLGVAVDAAPQGASATIPNDSTDLGKIIALLRKIGCCVGLKINVAGFDDLALISDLTALRSLDLSGTQVADLGPLKGLTALRGLTLARTRVVDLGPLKGLTALQSLYLQVTQVADLGPLAGLTALQGLDLVATNVADLRPLAGLTALQGLGLSGTQVADLGPLKGLTALQNLYLAGTNVADLGPLKGLTALQNLDLTGTKVRDLTPLQDLPNLSGLWVSVDPAEARRFADYRSRNALKAVQFYP